MTKPQEANQLNPNDGYAAPSEVVLYTGFAFVEDISKDRRFDQYFESGEQYKKRFYLSIDSGTFDPADILQGTIIEFNLSEVGSGLVAIDSTKRDYMSVQCNEPMRQGGLSILGSRHIELFAISYN